MENNKKATEILEIMTELSALSRLPRIGWILAGVRDAESISDHCYETALFAYFLSKHIERDVDIGKVLLMALFHEIGETRLSDLPRRSKEYVKPFKKSAEAKITADVLGCYSDELIELLDEFEAKKTLEARLTEAAEELQIIFKALLYAKENNGDISEYRLDVSKYNSLGVDMAMAISGIIGEKLERYLNGKEYWEIGYEKRS